MSSRKKIGNLHPLLREDRIGVFMRALHHLVRGKARAFGSVLRRYDALARVVGSLSGPDWTKALKELVPKLSHSSVMDRIHEFYDC